MKNFKLIFFLATIFSLTFLFDAQAQTAPTGDAGFNYSVDDLKIAKTRDGKLALKTTIGLFVDDKSRNRINMSFDLIIMKNGSVLRKITTDTGKRSAITCAVTCAGKCPSIFGDGVCTGCGCDYSKTLTTPLGGANDGDIFSVKIVPARGGETDSNPKDNGSRIVF